MEKKKQKDTNRHMQKKERKEYHFRRKGMKPKQVHIIMFMGQSNMAGRGDFRKAPIVKENMGYEFRAITAPDMLVPLREPFGKEENDASGVYEPNMKTGSLVSAFVNAYTDIVNAPVVGVSCAKGGSAIAEWVKGTKYYSDAVRRNRSCEEFLKKNQIEVTHRFMVWCQGCSDGDRHTPPEVYKEQTADMIHSFMKECQIEACFLIQIGHHRDKPELYLPIRNAQIRLAEQYEDIVLVSSSFGKFVDMGLMKDEFHYYQEGYNIVGEEAGANAGHYVLRHSEKKNQ